MKFQDSRVGSGTGRKEAYPMCNCGKGTVGEDDLPKALEIVHLDGHGGCGYCGYAVQWKTLEKKERKRPEEQIEYPLHLEDFDL